MKNILKWFLGFLIVLMLITGLKIAKFSLLRPPDMEQMADYKRNSDGPPHRQDGPFAAHFLNEPKPEKHPPFGAPPAGVAWAFALADLIDLLIYALALLPLFYAAYLLGKRTLQIRRPNTATASTIHSFKEYPTESVPVSARANDYWVSDNHFLDQLL